MLVAIRDRTVFPFFFFAFSLSFSFDPFPGTDLLALTLLSFGWAPGTRLLRRFLSLQTFLPRMSLVRVSNRGVVRAFRE